MNGQTIVERNEVWSTFYLRFICWRWKMMCLQDNEVRIASVFASQAASRTRATKTVRTWLDISILAVGVVADRFFYFLPLHKSSGLKNVKVLFGTCTPPFSSLFAMLFPPNHYPSFLLFNLAAMATRKILFHDTSVLCLLLRESYVIGVYFGLVSVLVLNRHSHGM